MTDLMLMEPSASEVHCLYFPFETYFTLIFEILVTLNMNIQHCNIYMTSTILNKGLDDCFGFENNK